MIASQLLKWKLTCLAWWGCLLSSADALDLPVSVEPLRTANEVRLLTYAEARMAPPVLLRVTVISHLPDGFDAQDTTGGLFFDVRAEEIPALGEQVEIRGNRTRAYCEWPNRSGNPLSEPNRRLRS